MNGTAMAVEHFPHSHPDLALLLIAMDNEIALMTDAEAVNDE